MFRVALATITILCLIIAHQHPICRSYPLMELVSNGKLGFVLAFDRSTSAIIVYINASSKDEVGKKIVSSDSFSTICFEVPQLVIAPQLCFSFKITQYNSDTHNVHTLTSL